MVFGWINLFNLAILIIMLIPNMLFAGKIRQEEGIERNTILRISEYVSRIACMIFMFFPISVGEFGFKNPIYFELYLLSNVLLLTIDLVVWNIFRKKPTFREALILAVVPSLIFFITGLLLQHWLLVISAGAFFLAHAMNTYTDFRNLS